MTRNNLQSHIAWLLQNQITTPSDLQLATFTIPATSNETVFEIPEESIPGRELRPPPARSHRIEQTPNAVPERPLPPPFFPTPITQSARVTQNESADAAMARLTSARKTIRPGLVSQNQQLGTPASTTGTSITNNYSQQLRDNGTPSRPVSTERARGLAHGGMFRPTPMKTPIFTGNFESVDLTGDTPPSRSSTIEEFDSDHTTLFTNGAASRAEPLEKNGKKRKSEDFSTKASPRKAKKVSKRTIEEREGSVDSFLDIDDSDVRPPLSPYGSATHYDSQRTIVPYTTVENESEDVDMVHEMLSQDRRTMERTLSRRGSRDIVNDRRSASRATPALMSGSQSCTTPHSVRHQTPTIQMRASPVVETKRESTSTPSPRKRPRPKSERIIQDSDDEDEMLDDVVIRTGFSQYTPLKKVPKVIESTPPNPRLRDVPAVGVHENDVKSPKKRVGSPLKQISHNVPLRPEYPSPFQQDSPTKSLSSRVLSQGSTESTASLSSEEKRIVNVYINSTTALSDYFAHLENLLTENKEAIAIYTEDGELPPSELREKRKVLVRKNNTHSAIAAKLQNLKEIKAASKAAAEKVMELSEIDCDCSAEEEQSKLLTQELHGKMKEFWQLLDTAGATTHVFATEVPKRNPSSSNKPSMNSSAQVILQTQPPPTRHNSPARNFREDHMVASAASGSSTHPTQIRYGSPSPRRRTSPLRSIPPNDFPRPNLVMKQPVFYERPPSTDYGIDDDFLDDLIEEDQAIQKHSAPIKKLVDEIEDDDDYGGFDDDEEMIGIAEQVEQMNSFNAASIRPATGTLRETPRNTSKSSKRSSLGVNKAQDMYSTTDPSHASMFKYPWSGDVKKALKDRFRLKGFRQNQLDAINATLGGEDAFVLMPTGGGKSLCYQLPAIVQSGKTKGVTIVISPLLALMDDQVEHLRKLGIQASLLNGDIPAIQKNCVFDGLREMHPELYIQLLYITPEMITNSQALLSALSDLHRKRRLARFVIDEAHCVSQWGHDFRPDYKNLSCLRERFPGVPFIALTATATENVKIDVIGNLGMENCKQLKQSFNRPNIYYEIRPKKGKGVNAEILGDIVKMLTIDYKNQSGIIYCLSRKNCEDLAAKLQDKGIRAHHFHAGMAPEDKKDVQHQWQVGELQVVVATIAFGMGIDKKNVRFVIHYTLPKTLEGYYQETGRAGRDGEPASCFLYYGYQDSNTYDNMIDKGDGSPQVKNMQKEMLKQMVRFCDNRVDCRRVQLLAYFGEMFKKEDCGNCDICNSGAVFQDQDYTREAHKALSVVKQIAKDNFTLLHYFSILQGKSSAKLKNMGHDKLNEFGSLRDWQRTEMGRLFQALLDKGALQNRHVKNKAGHHSTYTHLGPRYKEFMTGRTKLILQVNVSSPELTVSRKQTKNVAKKSSQPSSTLLTSPITQIRRNNKGKERDVSIEAFTTDDEFQPSTFTQEDVVASDIDESEEDAFEPRNTRGRRADRLGSPITRDKEMESLPLMHRLAVEEFVEKAKALEEEYRNGRGHKKPYFSELELRQMIIQWTTTEQQMAQIPGINIENVKSFVGKKFVKLINDYKKGYEEDTHRKTDKNHQTVIDLISDDDDDDVDDDFDEPSKFFTDPSVQAFNERMKQAERGPRQRTQADTPKDSYRRNSGGSKSKGRGPHRRRSSGSTATSNRSRAGPSGAGVTKKNASGGSRRTSGQSTSSRQSKIMTQFGRNGGGGGSGIAPMPT